MENDFNIADINLSDSFTTSPNMVGEFAKKSEGSCIITCSCVSCGSGRCCNGTGKQCPG